jgi:hypothetical protein
MNSFRTLNYSLIKTLAMKQKTKMWIAAATLSFISLCSFAQQEEQQTTQAPRWVSEKGYWVVETNIHTPLDQTIWFYNNDNLLVYKETLNGVRLNLSKRKVRMKLKKILEDSIASWQANKVTEQNKHYVAAILH